MREREREGWSERNNDGKKERKRDREREISLSTIPESIALS